jgi:hypothetical protein
VVQQLDHGYSRTPLATLELFTIPTKHSSLAMVNHVSSLYFICCKCFFNTVIGKLPEDAGSLFNYTLTTSNFTTQNPTNYTSIYNTSTQEPAYSNAKSNCALLTNGGSLAEECRSFVDFEPYYTACVFDVVATNDSSMVQSTIIAYSTICSQYFNASNGGTFFDIVVYVTRLTSLCSIPNYRLAQLRRRHRYQRHR